MADHRESIGAHPEREPRQPIRVVTDGFEHGRVDHATAEQLHPTSVRVNVHLGRRFGEGEMMRDELHSRVGAEELAGALTARRARHEAAGAETVVVIQPDPDSAVQFTVDVMDVADRLSLTKSLRMDIDVAPPPPGATP